MPNGMSATLAHTPVLGSVASTPTSAAPAAVNSGTSDVVRRHYLDHTPIGIGYDPGRVRSDRSPGSWVQDFGRS
jgi:hypothetical protein